jgi:AhpD family alkylhydroperoxidase
MSTQTFPERRRELAQRLGHMYQVLPDTMAAFNRLHATAGADGALPKATKELIALAIGIAVHCEGCIAFHVHDALAAGASPEEIEETVGVAVLMGGGPSVMYGADALAALGQFQAEH